MLNKTNTRTTCMYVDIVSKMSQDLHDHVSNNIHSMQQKHNMISVV